MDVEDVTEGEIKVLGVIENMAYLQCPNCKEKIDFYNVDELNDFFEQNQLKCYATLPMIDLIRDLNQYDTYLKEQQESVVSYLEQACKDLLNDL